jgi:purine nucleosidase
MSEVRPFLIDTDAAADDLIALLIALNAPDVAVEAITVVSGACSAEQGVQNVLYLLDMIDRQVPVYAGRQTPLLGELHDASKIMGRDGLGDVGLPLSGRVAAAGPAADAIRQKIRDFPGKLTIVCLGPLTNMALALATEPQLADQIGRLIVMGGVADGVGNITAAAEYNMYADPEAADIVFRSGVHIELVGWDLSRSESCAIRPADLDAIQAIGTPLARFSLATLAGLQRYLASINADGSIDFPDPLAMAIAVSPAVATGWSERHVTVVTAPGTTRGATVVDHLGAHGGVPNASIVTTADKAGMLALVHRAMKDLQASKLPF